VKAFIWTMRALALIPLVTGLVDLTLGMGSLTFGTPPSMPAALQASADNHWRFSAVVWAGYAPLLWYATTDVLRHAALLRILLIVLTLSGLGRALSVALMGLPVAPFTVAMVLELIGMPLMLLWLGHVLKDITLKR
jgi:hypothetical protein